MIKHAKGGNDIIHPLESFFQEQILEEIREGEKWQKTNEEAKEEKTAKLKGIAEFISEEEGKLKVFIASLSYYFPSSDVFVERPSEHSRFGIEARAKEGGGEDFASEFGAEAKGARAVFERARASRNPNQGSYPPLVFPPILILSLTFPYPFHLLLFTKYSCQSFRHTSTRRRNTWIIIRRLKNRSQNSPKVWRGQRGQGALKEMGRGEGEVDREGRWLMLYY